MSWEELLDQYYDQIFRYCWQFLGSKAEAEDAVQDTFMKASLGLKAIRNTEGFKCWIYTIARNTCIDRKRWWKRIILIDPPERMTMYSDGLSQSIEKALGQLPRMQREIFILRHWHGFSTNETAQLLGINSGTVKSHLKRAIDKLKVTLA